MSGIPDRPGDVGWWLASDGQWYPADLHPARRGVPLTANAAAAPVAANAAAAPVASGRARAASVVWALLPLVTFGMAAPLTFAYAAFRLRSRFLAFSAGVYGAAAFAFVYLTNINTSDHSWQSNLGVGIGLVAAAVSTGHALSLRRQVLAGPGQRPEEQASDRLQRRDRSRKIVVRNPRLADELRIGRPDLPRSFDDGGLVDVNRVPVGVLAAIPGLGGPLAARIVAVRTEVGGFDSIEDLEALLELAPQSLDPIRDVLICRR